jgi:hypothetical protein
MTTFSVLLYMNLKKVRRRIQPVIDMNQLLRKRDRDMIRMLLVIKSQQRLEIESFFSYLTGTFLLYINNGLSFWIYICTSRSFRLELKNLIMKFYGFITDRQIN